MPPSAGASAPNPRRQFADSLLAAIRQNGQLDPNQLVQALVQRRQLASAVQPAAAPRMASSTGTAGGKLAELLHEGVGGPTHSTGEHIHAASTDPRTVLAAIQMAQQLGLNVRENPYTDPVDPVHAPNSFHKRTFSGLYNGRKLGEAVDASGSQQAMQRYYQLLQQRFGR